MDGEQSRKTERNGSVHWGGQGLQQAIGSRMMLIMTEIKKIRSDQAKYSFVLLNEERFLPISQLHFLVL